MKLEGCAAVVTGGASGLGEATARALAAQGVKVAIFDRDEAKGPGVAADIGGVFCKVDVTSDESVDAGFTAARAAHGQERILINCAGVGNAIKTASRSREDGSIKHFPLDAFNMVIQINLIGTFRCIAKAAAGMLTLEPMEDGERGAIVNTASVAGEDGQMGQAAYSASKGGVIGMTLPIAREASASSSAKMAAKMCSCTSARSNVPGLKAWPKVSSWSSRWSIAAARYPPAICRWSAMSFRWPSGLPLRLVPRPHSAS